MSDFFSHLSNIPALQRVGEALQPGKASQKALNVNRNMRHIGKGLGLVGGSALLALGLGAAAYGASTITTLPDDQKNQGLGMIGAGILAAGAITVGGFALSKLTGGVLGRRLSNFSGYKTSHKLANNLSATVKGFGNTLKDVERNFVRPTLTGFSPRSSAVEAYLPNFNVIKDVWDFERYSLNPTIALRVGLASAATGTAIGMSKVLAPPAPEPTVVYDGTGMRHVRSMGANHQYAQALMRSS